MNVRKRIVLVATCAVTFAACAAKPVAAAEPGQKPEAVGGRVMTLVADIVKIGRKHQQVTLKGAEGKTLTVDVERPEVFDKIEVVDRVEITYTEAVGIDVRAAAK